MFLKNSQLVVLGSYLEVNAKWFTLNLSPHVYTLVEKAKNRCIM